MTNKYICLFYGLMILGLPSCSKFLDAKPEQSLALTDNLRDLEALLDYEYHMSQFYPASGDVASDYYYVTDRNWEAQNIFGRNTYTWDKNVENSDDWLYSYIRIGITNVVLDEVDNAKLGSYTEANRKEIKGRAYFFRGFSYYHLAQIYCPYYGKGVEDSEFGLPLKLSSDINEAVIRSSVKQTYQQIISDLNSAMDLLPPRSTVATRPSRVAVCALLARLYLILGDYEQSLAFATQCLGYNEELIDYNQLNLSTTATFTALNKEVLFHATMGGNSNLLQPAIALVNPDLVQKYKTNDLRKNAFLRNDGAGLYYFKGSYEGLGYTLFAGLALDEVYLIKAESQVRLNQVNEALSTLNKLLINRIDKTSFVPILESHAENLLQIILQEREKELLFRSSIRWTDLRRLNHEGTYAASLKRMINNVLYELPPNDLRYTFLLPMSVIDINSMKQNPR